ncbi:MAG: hypothetical protein ACLFVS_06415 [Candidatus Acetothermia bacterium]
MLKATRVANNLGIPSLFVETNSYWGRNKKGARNKLLELKDAGLKVIMISVNPFYVEYVPFENTKNASKTGK